MAFMENFFFTVKSTDNFTTSTAGTETKFIVSALVIDVLFLKKSNNSPKCDTFFVLLLCI